MHHVDHTMIGDLPARVEPQSMSGVALRVEGNLGLFDNVSE